MGKGGFALRLRMKRMLLAVLADKLVNVMDRALRPAAARLTGWLYRLIAPDAAE